MQELEAVGTAAAVHSSPRTAPSADAEESQHHASGVEASLEPSAEEASDVFRWEYVWVGVLVIAVLLGIGITAICLD